MRKQKIITALAGCLAAGMALGCGQQTAEAPPPNSSSAPAYHQGAPGPGGAVDTRQEAFLARIKGASQTNGVVQEARMNGDDELGVVLGSQVKLREVKPLMTVLLRQMRDEFPNRRLTVRAYAPNGKQMAVMEFDPAAPSNANVTYKTMM